MAPTICEMRPAPSPTSASSFWASSTRAIHDRNAGTFADGTAEMNSSTWARV